MTKSEAIEKIKKCLKLSASANENEAEIALRQAQALIAKYAIEDSDIDASEAGETEARSGASSKPANWETGLANKVAKAFGCNLVFIQGITVGEWSFIGISPNHEIAGYSFSVLKRQCKKARENYIKKCLRRCTKANATRRADLFCSGWVIAVSEKIHSMVLGDTEQLAIQAYLKLKYPTLETIESTNRNAGRNLREYDYQDRMHGIRSGRNAELNRGVDSAVEQGLLR